VDLAHIGIVRTLIAHGIVPNVVVGTSIGAVVGGAYAAGHLDQLEGWRAACNREISSATSISASMVGPDRRRQARGPARSRHGNTLIEELPLKFATVATEVRTGHEIWLTHGRIVDAMRASYALARDLLAGHGGRPLAG